MQANPSRKAGFWLALILLLTFFSGLGYSLLIPPWQGPDETGHFEYAWLIAHLGRLPRRGDVSPDLERELLASMYEWDYGTYIGRPLPEGMPGRLADLPASVYARNSRTILDERFSLSYVWQALFLYPVRSQDLVVQLRIARFSSVLLNVAVVSLAYKILSRLLSSHLELVWLGMATIALIPQHTFVNAMVGDGPLAEVMAAVVLYCWVQVFAKGGKPSAIAGIVLGTLAGIWSKTTAVFLVPLDLALALWFVMRHPRRAWSWRRVLFLSLAAILLAVAAWAWFRSPLGSTTWDFFQRSLSTGNLSWTDRRGVSLAEALLLSHDSFWAYFGWMALPVSGRWYGALLLLIGAGGLGWLFRSRDQEVVARWAVKLMALALVAAIAIFVWVTLLARSSGFYQFQGRYLFPVTIPVVTLLVTGWAQYVPPTRFRILGWTVVSFFVLFNIWCILAYIVPYFYPLSTLLP